jgi:transcriptional regulator with XRE-family HTH domain
MTPRDEGANWDSRLFERRLGAFGQRVRAVRLSHGWSQQDLGHRTEIDRADLSRIEGGRKNITLAVLWRLAGNLQVHWADLLDDRRTDPPETQHASVPFEQQLAAFGTRAYQARALQRLSQQALAERTGIGRSALSWIEYGTQNVTLETLSRLAAGLGVHWADLLDDRQTNPPQPPRSPSRST